MAHSVLPAPNLRGDADRGRRPRAGAASRLTLELRHWLRRERVQGYLYISPWLLGFALFTLLPLLRTAYLSLTHYPLFGTPQWVGLRNYQHLLVADAVFWRVVENMLVYVVAAMAITLGGGLACALVLVRRFPGNHVARTIIYLPGLLMGVATGELFKQVFASGPNGLANQALHVVGIPALNWLSDYAHPWLALVALVLVNLWFLGGTMLVFLAGLKNIAPSYYEAAQVDGAGSWRCFRDITLPLLTPVIVFNALMTLIGHLQVFELPLAFANQGGVGEGSNPLGYDNNLATFLTYLYVRAFVYNQMGYGAALAMILFLITLAVALLVLAVARHTVPDQLLDA
jgi:ABC-type sugar transport system permease subunit